MSRVQDDGYPVPDLSTPWVLPAGPRGVSMARRATRRQMRDLGVLDPEVIETIELLVSELTTNVVKHAGGRASLQVCRNDDVIRIEVRDASPAQVPVERDVDLDATHGRGLLLVSTLASSWGYERENDQKCTWAEFNLRSMASSDI